MMTKHGNDDNTKRGSKSAAAKSDAVNTDAKSKKIAPPTTADEESQPINASDWIAHNKKAAEEMPEAKKAKSVDAKKGPEGKKLPGFDSKKLDAADLKKLDDADAKKADESGSRKSPPRDHHSKRSSEERVAPSQDESET